MSRLSRETIRLPVEAMTQDGAPIDPATTTPEIAFRPVVVGDYSEPSYPGPDWHTAVWEADGTEGVNGSLITCACLLVGLGSDVGLAVGTYSVWLRATLDDEHHGLWLICLLEIV